VTEKQGTDGVLDRDTGPNQFGGHEALTQRTIEKVSTPGRLLIIQLTYG
jgi:hypothetical protein